MSELAMTARCVICQKLFAGPQLAIVGKGSDPEQNKIAQFAEKLAMHLAQTHKDQFQEILLAANEYQGMMILQRFSSDSEVLKQQFDVCRWKLHQATLAARYTDAMIDQWVDQVIPSLMTLAEMRDSATIKQNLVGMLLSIRDRLEEPDKYSFSAFDGQIKPGKAS